MGQQCRLPKVAIPKIMGTNDLVNVVCGTDSTETFLSQTARDGIDLEFDGSSDLSISIRSLDMHTAEQISKDAPHCFLP